MNVIMGSPDYPNFNSLKVGDVYCYPTVSTVCYMKLELNQAVNLMVGNVFLADPNQSVIPKPKAVLLVEGQ